MAAETIVIEVRADFKNNMGSGMSGATSQVDKFNQSVDKSKEKMRQLGGQNAQPKVSLVDRASSKLSTLGSKLNRFVSKPWKIGVSIVNKTGHVLSRIKNSLFSLKSLALTIGGALAVKTVAQKGIMEPIGLADQYSSAKIGFSTLLGNKKGQQMMNDLDVFAKKTPFKTSNTIEQAQKLVAMGWDAKNIVRDMYTIGDAAAATGKGDEGLQRISLALSQIKSKGKLSTEELNQLAEAGISAKRYIAEGLGYGSGDKGLAKMSKDLESGSIMANEAIDAILKGMKEYKGMMDKTANETVEGLKSQIEDTFEINVFRKWGQGLQDGAKKGLGSIVGLLDKSEDGLKSLGDNLYKIGKQLSNWAAGKLEGTIDKIMKLTDTKKFKDASVFGKIGMIAGTTWDELIAKPFGSWWDSTGKPYIEGKFKDFGKMMGKGLTNATMALGKGILTLLGVDTSGMEVFKEASDVGSNFGKGFAEGFDGKKVMNTIKDVFVSGFKALFNGKGGVLGNIIKAGITLKLTSGILSAFSSVAGLWNGTGGAAGSVTSGGGVLSGVGLKGLVGSASTASGSLVGTGFVGNMAKFGSFLGSGAYTGGGLAAVGAGATAGGILGGIGLYQGGKDVYKAVKANNSNDRKHYGWRGGTKIGMVGAGAAAGAAIGSIIPIPGISTAAGALIGAGIGGIGALWKGNDLADSISGVTKSGEELKNINLDKHFGNITLRASDLQKQVKKVFGVENLRATERYKKSVQDVANAASNMRDKFETIDFITFQTKHGVKWTEDMKNEYINAVKGVQSDVQTYISKRNVSDNAAVDLLFGDMEMGKKIKEGNNKYYAKYTKRIQKIGQELNDYLGKAIKDGKISDFEQDKINEIVDKMEKVEDEAEKKLREREFKAKIEGIKFDYGVGSGKMDKESFKKLNDSLNETLKTEIEEKKNTRDQINASLAEQGYSEDSEKVKANNKQYLDESLSVTLTVSDVSIKGMEDAYGEEISKFKDKIDKLTPGSLSDPLKKKKVRGYEVGTYFGLEAKKFEEDATSYIENVYGISEDTQKAIGKLVESMQPQKKQLEELKSGFEQMGLEVPKTLQDQLDKINLYEAMSGNVDAMYKIWADEIAKGDKKDAVLKSIKDGTSDLPEKLQDAIKEACEEGSKVTDPVEIDTNLKLKADKKNIDTSKLDKDTKSLVEKLKDKGVIVEKDGKVKIKTKDGKIDTDGLDKDTKAAIEKLRKKGIIVEKDGNVTIKPKKVETKNLDKATTKAAKSLEKKGLIKINKKGKVSITKKGGINTKDLDKQTKKAVKSLEKAGVLKIDKKGNVKIKAKVNTKDAEKKSKDKTKKNLGKKQNVKKNANVKVKSKTKTSDEEKKCKEKVKRSLGKKQNVKKKANVKVDSKTNTASAKKKSNAKVKKEMSKKLSLKKTATVNVKDDTKTADAKKNSESKIKTDLQGPVAAKTRTNVTASFGGFNGTLSTLKNTVFNKIKSDLASTTATTTVNIKARRIGGPTAKQQEGHNANGSRIDRETLTWVGENNNREYIIPTTSGKRKRGLSLWLQAGKDLGVMNNADGGVYGSTSGSGSVYGRLLTEREGYDSVKEAETSQTPSRNGKVEINVGGVTIEINSSGDGIPADVENNKDKIISSIADALEQAWQNMPVATE